MADIEVKTYTSSDGTKVNKINYYSGSYYSVTRVENGISRDLTPCLNSVDIDEENNVLLCQKNFLINNDVVCKIYFYLNFKGEVISLAYSNLSDNFFTIKISSEEDTYPFETFDKQIEKIQNAYGNRMNKRLKRNAEISRKVALVKKGE